MKTYIAIFAGALLTTTIQAAGNAPIGSKTNQMACVGRACCRPPQAKAPATADPGAEERFRMKFGRNTPAEETRQRAAQEVYAKNMIHCEAQGCGRGVHEKPVAGTNAEVKGDPGAEMRFRMKYGRSTPVDERRLVGNREKATVIALASADRMICEPGCCDHAR